MSVMAVKVVLLLFSYFILTRGEYSYGEDNGGNVWNFFFGGKEKIQPGCQSEQLTCETRNASVTYVHWGRGDCNTETSTLVYSGYMGGGHYSHSGAGTNALCLPTTPEYDDDLVATTGWRSYVYGAEIELIEGDTYLPSDLYNTNPLCAVCLAHSRSTTLMIPAKLTCPTGWQLEYIGVLMGSYSTHAAGHEYFCFDKSPEVRHGSATTNHNGFLFYPILGKCGSLPCPPYADGDELSCVVCSW